MKLLVQSDDGIAPLLAATRSAKKSIDILIFRMDWKELGGPGALPSAR